MIFLLTVNYRSSYLIQKLINSLPDRSLTPYQLMIVNNSSEDTSLDTLKKYDFISIIHSPKNLGFGSACNIGIRRIFKIEPQAIIWIINPDAYLPQINFKEVTEFFNTHSELSIVGTIVYDLQGKIWFSGGKFIADRGSILHMSIRQNDQDYVFCDWVSGCSLLINLKKFSEPPLFDTQYFLYYEDLDFCQRYRSQGYSIAITSKFNVVHAPSSITNQNQFNKIRHSTFSYLLTLKKYSPLFVQILGLIKLFIYAIILLPFKTDVAIGKLMGITNYVNHLQLKRKNLL